MKSCAISIRGEPNEILCDQHTRRTKIKSCAISIRGEPRLSSVQSAYEANQMKSCAISMRGETKMKTCASSIRGRLSQIKKKSLFPVVLDKMCVFCLYPIPDSQQCVKRGNCKRPILSDYLFHFNVCWTLDPFISRFDFGPRTYFVMCYLFYRIFESFGVGYLFRVNCCFVPNLLFVFKCRFVKYCVVPCFSY